MKKIKTSIFLTIIALLGATTGCNNSNPDDLKNLFTDFATLESVSPSTCSFAVQESDDSTPAVLTADLTLDPSEFKLGARYVIQYTTPDNKPYTPGKMDLYNIIGVYNGKVKDEPMEIIYPLITDPDPVSLDYVSRRGKWLNLRAVAPINMAPELVEVYADESTLENEYPDVYFVFKSDNPGSQVQKYFYASFDISSVFDLPTAKGINFHFRSNGTIREITFKK